MKAEVQKEEKELDPIAAIGQEIEEEVQSNARYEDNTPKVKELNSYLDKINDRL